MSVVGHPRARNVRFGVLIVSDAATLILSDGQQPVCPSTAVVMPTCLLRQGQVRDHAWINHGVRGPAVDHGLLGQDPTCPLASNIPLCQLTLLD